MTYRDAIEYANEKLLGHLVVILNADIFLGTWPEQWNSIFQDELLRRLLFENTCWSLTRHEPSLCIFYRSPNTPHKTPCACPFLKGTTRYFGSHDSFWFQSPIRIGKECNFVQNKWGAEHKMINILFAEGYRVENPSRSIRTFHHHATDVHPWRNEPGGNDVLADPRDHKPLPPTYLEDLVVGV